jgi:hypothetical protein
LYAGWRHGRQRGQRADRRRGRRGCLYRTGTCSTVTFVGTWPGDCNQPHAAEVAGVVDAGGRTDHAPSRDELFTLVGDECRAQVETYLGRPLDPSLATGLSELHPESWADGSTKVNCLVGPRGEGTSWGTAPGPLRG